MEQILIVDCKADTFLGFAISEICFYKNVYDSRLNLTLMS